MHILIIRPGAIGDTLLAFKHSIDTHVTFVGNSAVLPLALAYGIVDKVFDYQDYRVQYAST